MSTPIKLGTRAAVRFTATPQFCAAACGRMIDASRIHKMRVVVANVYVNAKGKMLSPARRADPAKGHRWDRTEIFHEACYDGRYGEPAALEEKLPDQSRI